MSQKNGPYREGGQRPIKRLPRMKARLRGLFRRIAAPTMIIGIIGGVVAIGNIVC